MNIRNILIAVDPSENAKRAVAYVGDMVCGAKGFRIELLHVSRPPDRDLCPDEASWHAKAKAQEGQVEAMFQEARAFLEARGVPPDAISCQCIPAEGPTVAQRVLDVQREGEFGTVVIGRRGVSKAEEFLFGSVSNKIVHYAQDCTVWVVQ
jgi:nucleotide-binding universal stress UspA family protein